MKLSKISRLDSLLNSCKLKLNRNSTKKSNLSKLKKSETEPALECEGDISLRNRFSSRLPSIPSLPEKQIEEHEILAKIDKEYADVVIASKKYDRSTPCEAALLPQNSTKNRYTDIIPFDSTRVVLKTEDDNDTDYINASHISLKVDKCIKNYIATQGPLPTTIYDFWRMVWEQHTTTIVMLANEYEGGRYKCARYWPLPNKATETHKHLKVTLESELVETSHIIRLLKLENLKNGKQRNVTQFHYTRWPDFGVPSSVENILEFLKVTKVWIDRYGDESGPQIVHCSGGVGRTGTYCVVDTAYASRHRKAIIPLQDLVLQMRENRSEMVQGPDQYAFCYQAIMHIQKEGNETEEKELRQRELG